MPRNEVRHPRDQCVPHNWSSALLTDLLLSLELVLAVLLSSYQFERSSKDIDWKLYITLTPYAQGDTTPRVPVKIIPLYVSLHDCLFEIYLTIPLIYSDAKHWPSRWLLLTLWEFLETSLLWSPLLWAFVSPSFRNPFVLVVVPSWAFCPPVLVCTHASPLLSPLFRYCSYPPLSCSESVVVLSRPCYDRLIACDTLTIDDFTALSQFFFVNTRAFL